MTSSQTTRRGYILCPVFALFDRNANGNLQIMLDVCDQRPSSVPGKMSYNTSCGKQIDHGEVSESRPMGDTECMQYQVRRANTDRCDRCLLTCGNNVSIPQ